MIPARSVFIEYAPTVLMLLATRVFSGSVTKGRLLRAHNVFRKLDGPSVRHPVGVMREEAIHESHLVDNKQAEAQADGAAGQG